MDDLPLELEYRLTFGDRVLWWGRPGRLAIAGRRDLAALPVVAIVAATAAVIAFVPGPAWHPVVATIFRLAFAASAVSLIVTHLTIVVRQRRRRFYAVTRDRVLLGHDFWSGGFRAVPLERIIDATVDAGPAGDGTITLVVDDGTCPQLAHVANADGVRATLMKARADLLGRLPAQVPLEIRDTLEPDERLLWWGRPKQGRDIGNRRTLSFLLALPFLVSVFVGAWTERSVVLTVLGLLMTLAILVLAAATVSIDATVRFHTLYAITDRAVLVLGWKWRQGRRTIRLPFTALRYSPSVTVRPSGAGTIHFTPERLERRGLAPEPIPSFQRIADVKAVVEIFDAASEAARRQASGDASIR
jgi:hypothetical protein